MTFTGALDDVLKLRKTHSTFFRHRHGIDEPARTFPDSGAQTVAAPGSEEERSESRPRNAGNSQGRFQVDLSLKNILKQRRLSSSRPSSSVPSSPRTAPTRKDYGAVSQDWQEVLPARKTIDMLLEDTPEGVETMGEKMARLRQADESTKGHLEAVLLHDWKNRQGNGRVVSASCPSSPRQSLTLGGSSNSSACPSPVSGAVQNARAALLKAGTGSSPLSPTRSGGNNASGGQESSTRSIRAGSAFSPRAKIQSPRTAGGGASVFHAMLATSAQAPPSLASSSDRPSPNGAVSAPSRQSLLSPENSEAVLDSEKCTTEMVSPASGSLNSALKQPSNLSSPSRALHQPRVSPPAKLYLESSNNNLFSQNSVADELGAESSAGSTPRKSSPATLQTLGSRRTQKTPVSPGVHALMRGPSFSRIPGPSPKMLRVKIPGDMDAGTDDEPALDSPCSLLSTGDSFEGLPTNSPLSTSASFDQESGLISHEPSCDDKPGMDPVQPSTTQAVSSPLRRSHGSSLSRFGASEAAAGMLSPRLDGNPSFLSPRPSPSVTSVSKPLATSLSDECKDDDDDDEYEGPWPNGKPKVIIISPQQDSGPADIVSPSGGALPDYASPRFDRALHSPGNPIPPSGPSPPMGKFGRPSPRVASAAVRKVNPTVAAALEEVSAKLRGEGVLGKGDFFMTKHGMSARNTKLHLAPDGSYHIK